MKSSIINIESLAKKRALIRLLDEAIAIGEQLNRQLDDMDVILALAHERQAA